MGRSFIDRTDPTFDDLGRREVINVRCKCGREVQIAPHQIIGQHGVQKHSESDEHYLIDLCDEVLGFKARRQHRFAFLIGDPSPTTQRCVRLPVDAFYSECQLVVEIMERQHNEAVALFDGKPTLSGIPRGEQRRRYDERRQTLLPKHGFRLVVLDIADFDITSRKKLRRNRPADLEIVRSKLKMAEG